MKRTYIGLGLFVVVTLGALVYLAQAIGALGGGGGTEYELRLRHAAGLVENNAVKIAGVKVGRVAEISVDHDIAVLTLQIDEQIVLHSDTMAIVRAKSLLGEKYLQLHPGTADGPVLSAGGSIVNVESPFEIDEVLNSLKPILGGEDSLGSILKPLVGTLNDVIGDAAGKDGKAPIISREEVRQMIEDAKATTAATRRMVESNEKPVGELVAASNRLLTDPRIPRIIGRVDSTTRTLDRRLPALLDKTEAAVERLERLAGIVDDDRAKKLGTIIDDAAVATANLRELSDELKGLELGTLDPLLADLAIVVKRATAVDGKLIRRFFQNEGMKIYVGNKREARKALREGG